MATTYKMSSASLKMRRLDKLPSLSGASSHNDSGSSHDASSAEDSESSAASSSEPSPTPSSSKTMPKTGHSRNQAVISDDDEKEDDDEKLVEGDEGSDESSNDDGSHDRSPSPVVPEGQYEVEKIIDYGRDDSGDLYLVKWKNWESEFNTWEPPRNLLNCDSVMMEFYLARKKEYEEALSDNNNYVVTENGRKRRRGKPLPLVPPDPRPIADKVEEFFGKYGEMTEDEIDACHRRFAGRIKFENRLLNAKLKKLLHSALDNKLSDEEISRLRKNLLEEEFIRKKVEHNNIMRTWEDSLNEKTLGKPRITVENEVDWEGPPVDFTYINDYMATSGITIPEDPPLGCDCKFNCSDKSNCCSATAGVKFAYTPAGRLKVPVGTPIYECNNKCKCDASCPNRVVQSGQNLDKDFCIFRTSNGRGWGVKTLKKIPKGTFVTLYVGEVIDTEEAERRGNYYDQEGITYLFDLDFNEGESCPYTVDAAHFGNVAHFINHSCDPNLGVFAVWVNCLDPNLPKLALFAIQDISKGEEITFYYMNLIVDQKTKLTKRCKCGSSSCREFLF